MKNAHCDITAVEDGVELLHGSLHVGDLLIGGRAKGDEAGQRLLETADHLRRPRREFFTRCFGLPPGASTYGGLAGHVTGRAPA